LEDIFNYFERWFYQRLNKKKGERRSMRKEELYLLKKGKERLDWAEKHAKVLSTVAKEMKEKQSLRGLKIGMALHVEAKTGLLALALHGAGADVRLAGCNPLTTDDSVAFALKEEYGLPVFARKGETREEYYQNLNSVLDLRPHIVIDDGCDLITLLHTERRELLPNLKGGNEETTTGVLRLKSMEKAGALAFPVIAVNDAKMKYLFDNRYGTGQSTFDGIMTATNLLIAGKNFVVAGYGWCGRGIAMRARGMGAKVVVTEVDPVRAIEAHLDGFEVMPMEKAVRGADFVVTATGNRDIITKKHLRFIKNGCVLANAGHFNNEINLGHLEEMAEKCFEAKEMVKGYTLKNGRTVYLLADGRLVNLAVGQGHPVEIMDMSFSIQARCVEYIVREGSNLKPKVYPVPKEVDEEIARLKLKTLGIKIDKLSKIQKNYLSSWKEGT